MGKITERLYNGIVKENPTFVQMLGMCPTLAVTTAAINGLGMGLATTVILTMSNLVISILRKAIPDKVRIPAYIVVIASFVTIIQFIMQAYLPELNDSLGLFIPLIVVNCIILGRAEAYASKNKLYPRSYAGQVPAHRGGKEDHPDPLYRRTGQAAQRYRRRTRRKSQGASESGYRFPPPRHRRCGCALFHLHAAQH